MDESRGKEQLGALVRLLRLQALQSLQISKDDAGDVKDQAPGYFIIFPRPRKA